MKGEVRPRKESQPSWARHLLPSSQNDSCSRGGGGGLRAGQGTEPFIPYTPHWEFPRLWCALLPQPGPGLSAHMPSAHCCPAGARLCLSGGPQRGPSSSHGLHSHKQAGRVFKLQIWSMASCGGLSVMLCLKSIHAGTCRSASCPSSPRPHTTLL